MITTKIRRILKREDHHLSILSDFLGVFLVWWGVWVLMDTYFFPNQKLFGAILAIVLGIISLLIDDFKLKELK